MGEPNINHQMVGSLSVHQQRPYDSSGCNGLFVVPEINRANDKPVYFAADWSVKAAFAG
jgi:hypothetical protein